MMSINTWGEKPRRRDSDQRGSQEEMPAPEKAFFASKMSGSPVLLKTITHLQIITLKMLEFVYH